MKRLQSLPALFLISIMAANSLRVYGSGQSADHAFSLNVVFLSFAPETVNTTLVDSSIRKSHSFTYGNYTMNYEFETARAKARFWLSRTGGPTTMGS